MSSRPGPRFPGSVTLRLTLWHAGLFAIVSLATFAAVYLTVRSHLVRRNDRELAEDVREVEHNLMAAPGAGREAAFLEDFDPADAAREFRVLLAPSGVVRLASDLSVWRRMALAPPGIRSLEPGRDHLRTVSVPGYDVEARVIARRLPDGSVLELGTSLADIDELLAVLRRILLLGWIAMIVPGVFVGWFVARKAMRGVERVTAIAARIRQGGLAERVPVGHEGDEIERLATGFNDMLDRIQRLVRELEDVTSNVAHDLKSPITRIRGLAEGTAIAGAQPDESAAGWIVDECDRLVKIIDTTLEIAAADAGVSRRGDDVVDISAVVRDAVDLFHPVAEDRGIRITSAAPPGAVTVRGETGRVQRVIANLLDNAIKYTGPGGAVTVSVRSDDGRVTVSIADTGIGIDPESLPRVFERFYRGDASRSTAGHGLGLSLASAIVRAHGGEITVQSAVGRGSEFIVHWPASGAGPPRYE